MIDTVSAMEELKRRRRMYEKPPVRQPHKANDPATLRCDNEPCLFHHLGICRFSCHAWQPCATHTSPPAQFKCPDCERLFDSDIHLGIHHYTDHAIKHDAQVAKAAREQVLLEYAAWDDTRYTTQRINEFREQTTSSREA
jgi:hypothetical protein